MMGEVVGMRRKRKRGPLEWQALETLLTVTALGKAADAIEGEQAREVEGVCFEFLLQINDIFKLGVRGLDDEEAADGD
jgi:hypothetical protein